MRILAVTQTPKKDYLQTPEWKIHEWILLLQIIIIIYVKIRFIELSEILGYKRIIHSMQETLELI